MPSSRERGEIVCREDETALRKREDRESETMDECIRGRDAMRTSKREVRSVNVTIGQPASETNEAQWTYRFGVSRIHSSFLRAIPKLL